MSRARELTAYLEGVGSLAIVPHDNPDPDAIASALALARIARFAGADRVTLCYGGTISHQQNRAFVNLLDVDLRPLETVDLGTFDAVAFVDHATPGRNVGVPADTEVDVVIDHHPAEEPVDAAFVDRRDDYGATATILVEYLRDLGIEPDERLAAALQFAIHRERLDFIRGPTSEDYRAASSLHEQSDDDLLDRLYGSAFSGATLDAIGEAIRTRTKRGSTLVSSVGRTRERDALPQAADYLLNLEGVDTVLVFGLVGDAIAMSARSIDPRVDLGRVLVAAFGDAGEAGGHHDMAGARLPLGILADPDDETDEELLNLVSRRVRRRFLDAMNIATDREGE
jgi:nanoRNase/pAp phosphatase (c-di-AMP/oligoRNAs hydrolase)